MRIASYRQKFGPATSGIVVDGNGNDDGPVLADVSYWYEVAAVGSRTAGSGIPGFGTGAVDDLLRGGAPALDRLRAAEETLQAELASTGVPELLATGRLTRVGDVNFLPTVVRPSKIMCVGRNYADHLQEAGHQPARGDFPSMFAKFPSSLVGHEQDIAAPTPGVQFDYENELAVIIGKRCVAVSPEDALKYVAGYTVMLDLSDRTVQQQGDAWGRKNTLMGKNFPRAAPLGPWLVTSDEIPDPQALDLKTLVDGDLRQDDSSGSMLWAVAEIVSSASRVTLEPGDVISTGTPAGVGAFAEKADSALLADGQTVEASISKIGTLVNHVVAAGTFST